MEPYVHGPDVGRAQHQLAGLGPFGEYETISVKGDLAAATEQCFLAHAGRDLVGGILAGQLVAGGANVFALRDDGVVSVHEMDTGTG